MRIRQLHQDLARLTREVGPYGGLDSDGGAIDAVLWIVYRLRATLGEFENAHRPKMTHPFIVGDVVRCLIGTALEHETLVTGIATNDAGEHFVSLESNRGFGCTIPASHVLLVRRVGESGPLEDVHGPVAGDQPGATVPASDLASRVREIITAMDAMVNGFDKGFVYLNQRIDGLSDRIVKLEGEWYPIIAAVGQALGAEIARQNKETGK